MRFTIGQKIKEKKTRRIGTVLMYLEFDQDYVVHFEDMEEGWGLLYSEDDLEEILENSIPTFTQKELKILWDAVTSFCENHDHADLPNEAESVKDKLDTHFANLANGK